MNGIQLGFGYKMLPNQIIHSDSQAMSVIMDGDGSSNDAKLFVSSSNA